MAAAAAAGFRSEVVRRFEAGAWGAWLVRRADGHGEAVLKCVWDADWRPRLASAQAAVDALAGRGAPVPRFLAVGYEPGLGTWYAVEHVPGEPVARLTPALLDGVLVLSGLQAGAAAGVAGLHDWDAAVRAALPRDLARVRRAGGERLERVARSVDAVVASAPVPGRGDDVVHGDFVATQLLAGPEGRLAGVLDWDGAGRGDRVQDLALLFYNAHAQADRLGERPDEALLARLAREALAISPAFALYLAYEAAHALAFVLERNPGHVEWRTSLAERVLARYERLVR